MSTLISQQFERQVAPIGANDIKAKISRDVEASFYAKAAKDTVEESIYNRV